MAPSSKETWASVTKLFFGDASRQLGLTPNPAAELPSTWASDTSDRRILVPHLGEVEKLARALDDVWPLPVWARDLYGPNGEGRGDIVRLLAYSGMRWEESAALPTELVNRGRKIMYVRYTATESGGKRVWADRTKTTSGERYITIVPQIFEVIDRLDAFRKRGLEREVDTAARRAARGSRGPTVPPTGLWSLLVSADRGGFISYGLWRKKLDEARKISGVDLTAHELRHVAASIFFAAHERDENPWSTIAYQLGHSSARETERIYKHAFLDDKTAVAEMLGVRIGKIFERGEHPTQHDRW